MRVLIKDCSGLGSIDEPTGIRVFPMEAKTRIIREHSNPQGGQIVPRGRAVFASITGWLLVAFSTQHLAAQSTFEGYPPESGSSSGYEVPFGPQVRPTGMDQMRQYPHPAPPWAATHGYPNYDHPDHHFGIWFRSQAWGLTKRERCAFPEPFRPRGYGNLFARPTTSHRMDYSRPVLADEGSQYGPSYYVRQPDPRCCARDCDGHLYRLRSAAADRAAECPQ